MSQAALSSPRMLSPRVDWNTGFNDVITTTALRDA
jgi:hypothetical protein